MCWKDWEKSLVQINKGAFRVIFFLRRRAGVSIHVASSVINITPVRRPTYRNSLHQVSICTQDIVNHCIHHHNLSDLGCGRFKESENERASEFKVKVSVGALKQLLMTGEGFWRKEFHSFSLGFP